MPITPDASILALDVGQQRIGIAIAGRAARIATPLKTIANDERFIDELQSLIDEHSASQLVVGLPRGMEGQETAQTGYVRDFCQNLQASIKLPVAFQDEALTSVKAEAELEQRGKGYTKEQVDALSATYILEDYLQGNTQNV